MRFGQRHFKVISQVRAARVALPATTTTTPTHEVAEQVIKHIAKGIGKITLISTTKATAWSPTTTFESGVTKSVVGCFFLASLSTS